MKINELLIERTDNKDKVSELNLANLDPSKWPVPSGGKVAVPPNFKPAATVTAPKASTPSWSAAAPGKFSGQQPYNVQQTVTKAPSAPAYSSGQTSITATPPGKFSGQQPTGQTTPVTTTQQAAPRQGLGTKIAAGTATALGGVAGTTKTAWDSFKKGFYGAQGKQVPQSMATKFTNWFKGVVGDPTFQGGVDLNDPEMIKVMQGMFDQLKATGKIK